MPGSKKGLTGCFSSQNSDSSPDSDQRFWNKSPEGWRRSTYVHPSYSTLDVPKYVHGTPPPTASTFGSDSRIGTPPAPASGFRSDPRITPYFDKNPATSSTYAASGYGTRSQISTGSTRPLYSGAPPLPSGPSFAARTGGQPGVSPVHTVRKVCPTSSVVSLLCLW